MILRQTAFYFLIVSFWFVLLFISIPASAEEIEYAHAIVTTSAGKEIPVEVADTIKKRSLGLGKRSVLKKGWGMLFVFEKRKMQRFWMKDMQFPLDIIWLDNHRIVQINNNVQPVNSGAVPELITSSVPVNFVLEIAAGHAEELKLKTGQRLKYKF
ncbi:MAG: hypothetical protein MAG581_00703 [Deltaproteobacteria bacterium]|jgi:uncharacterized membrane protein (UPF0127 family)|nr:hypothetical protein [Deltaproteobacteria bacterium]